MKKFVLALGLGLLALNQAHAGSPDPRDRASIEAMAGCYEVRFQFSETFSKDKDYTTHSPAFDDHGIEWVDLDQSSETHVALQHVLVTPDGAQKHWRQEWTYEPAALWQYKGDLLWTKGALAANEGLWVQSVGQVDDSPRYQCAAPWIHWGDKNYWECETWAPLPRREFTQRNDYNVLSRRNRHEIYSWGWLQEEDNTKLKVANGQSDWVAKEKGLDSYRRIDDAACAPAREWWNANKSVWHEIQGVWKDLYATQDQLHFVGQVNGKTLWMNLFELADTTAAQKDWAPTELQSKTRSAIAAFLVK